MKEFLFIYKSDGNPFASLSPDELQKDLSAWKEWFAAMAAQDSIADKGKRLAMAEGVTVHSDHAVTDYRQTAATWINGYTVIKAATLEEATALAKGCPLLQLGGAVEVRTIMPVTGAGK